MNYLKAAPLAIFGFVIDMLQTGISVAVPAVAANAGTIGGAAAGCLAGSQVAGKVGCAVGGALFGFLGTYLNPVSGPVLVPVAAMLAVILCFCISLTFGTALVVMLAFMGMLYPWQVGSTYAADLLPVMPGWTALPLRAAHRKNKEERRHIHAKAA